METPAAGALCVTQPAFESVNEHTKQSWTQWTPLFHTTDRHPTVLNAATDIDDDLCITVQGLYSRKHPSRHTAGAQPLPQQPARHTIECSSEVNEAAV